ncbi:MAG: M20/M25/M40 family metallo-hydrolase [Planctomycetota bacterium]|nr:M20/M25/M40 family metallo-hydrolase [Planctomycetota bacterium]
MDVDRVLKWLGDHEEGSISRLMDWLRIPSISTDPQYKVECRRAADWAAEHLRRSGFRVEVCPTGVPGKEGHPVVMAWSDGAPDYRGPHVLFYGHYDVQPADPLELWESPPFEPAIREGSPNKSGPGRRIVARGAVDDKGQVMCFLEAMRAWKETTGRVAGGMKVTVMLEGEEESGSVNLDRFVHQRATELKRCDVCVISDTGMLDRGRPAITYGVRGLSYTEVILRGPNQDLHSGLWGGRVPNPISELCKVLAKLWDADRRVTIPGFYDDVRPLAPSERQEWANLNIDPAAQLAEIGLAPDADVGEKGFTATERTWGRPTAEINGITGGYTGKGAKTVIGAHASAKVSFRLVADQNPAKITAAFFDWCRANTPQGCSWEFIDHSGGWPVTVATESRELSAAKNAVHRACGSTPAMIKSGGSIPIAGLLKSELGIDTIFMGFGLDDDRVHSPNEKFELDCFRIGARSHALLVDELAKLA